MEPRCDQIGEKDVTVLARRSDPTMPLPDKYLSLITMMLISVYCCVPFTAYTRPLIDLLNLPNSPVSSPTH